MVTPEEYAQLVQNLKSKALRARANQDEQKAFISNIEDTRSRSRSELQKQQNAMQRPIDDKPKESKMDAKRDQQFKISIAFLMSDNRRRDLDGMLTTILDCLCAAGRQMADLHQNNNKSNRRTKR